MQFILWVILGLVAGFAGLLAAYRSFPDETSRWLVPVVVGVVGGLVGGWLAGVFGFANLAWLGVIIVGFVAAAAVAWFMRRSATT